MTPTTARIIAGPSLWDLMLSLFEEKRVTFTTEDETLTFVVSGVMDHKYWDYLDDQELENPVFLLTGEYKVEGGSAVVHACYSTHNRAGLLSIVFDMEDDNKEYRLLHQEWARRILGESSTTCTCGEPTDFVNYKDEPVCKDWPACCDPT